MTVLRACALNCAALLSGIALSWAVGEAAARSLHLSRTWDSYVATNTLQYSLRTGHAVGYRYRPGATWTGSRGVGYAINSEGFRQAPPAAACRCPQIAFLGDSVTEGFGVEADQRFSFLVERALAGAGTKTQCLNYGIASHATRDQTYVLTTDLAKRHLDVVVLQVGFNDLERNASTRTATSAPQPVESRPGVARRWLHRHSALYLALAERYNLTVLRLGGVNDMLAVSQAIDDQGWEPTRMLLGEFLAATRERTLALIVFYAPLDAEVQSQQLAGRSALGGRLASFCRDEGVTFVDVGAVLSGARHENLYLDDVHLTPRGHELVAATLLEPLREAIADLGRGSHDGSPEVSLDAGRGPNESSGHGRRGNGG